MKISEARELLEELKGNSGRYIEYWGRSIALEVCRTFETRQSSTQDEIDEVIRIREALRRLDYSK
jgi:hypothetical protein